MNEILLIYVLNQEKFVESAEQYQNLAKDKSLEILGNGDSFTELKKDKSESSIHLKMVPNQSKYM